MRARGGPGLRSALALAALVVSVLVLLVLDQRHLTTEQAAVDGCQVQAAQATRLADRRLDATASYLSPARVPGTELAATLLSEAAGAARPAVEAAAQACGTVQVRPWHPGTAARRDNLTDYLAARLVQLAQVEADGTRYYGDQSGDAELERLRGRAFPGAA